MSIEEIGIVNLDHKSCAAINVQYLADAGVTDWRTAFNMQIENSKKMGLMPDDFKVIRETLRACSVSFKNNTDKSEGEHLKRILQKSFTIFPKSAAFVK